MTDTQYKTPRFDLGTLVAEVDEETFKQAQAGVIPTKANIIDGCHRFMAGQRVTKK